MSFSKVASGLALLSCGALAQQPGTQQEEVHPTIWTQECEEGRGRVPKCRWEKSQLVMDANWRWVNKDGTNCYTNDNTWDPTLCPDGKTCAKDCSIEGADYKATYGVSTNRFKTGVDLAFVTVGTYSSNFGSRLYLMDSEDTYKQFYLLNKEFTFTVDVSKLTCGLNGALYFVEMDKHGDTDAVYNNAGAKYGTGYCDAQCPHDLKFIKGEANVLNWDSTSDPPTGNFGACCAEMDIWEANGRSTAYTPHPCSEPGLTKCEGTACGDNNKDERYDGICDKDGCDFNNYRMGGLDFYGKGGQFDVDTSKPVTVVTQFLTHDGTDTGELTEIKRYFVQNGRVIPNSEATILGEGCHDNSVTDDFCSKQKAAFGDLNDFERKGGLKTMGEALGRGMTLVLSLWDDSQVNMLWLDSKYPTDEPSTKPGVMRGPCAGGRTSMPKWLRKMFPKAKVSFSKIKVGTIGSTSAAPGKSDRRLSPEVVV